MYIQNNILIICFTAPSYTYIKQRGKRLPKWKMKHCWVRGILRYCGFGISTYGDIWIFRYYIILEFQGATRPLFQACRLAFPARTQGLALLASHAVHARSHIAHFTCHARRGFLFREIKVRTFIGSTIHCSFVISFQY